MKPLYTQDFLGDNRKRNVSLSCTFLEKQLAESKDKSDRIELVSILRLCRALKKIMKST